MAIEFKKQTFYPSISKQGIFFDDNDESDAIWENLSGIDDNAIDRYKFSLGSWVEFRRKTKKIFISPLSVVDSKTFPSLRETLTSKIFDEIPEDVFVGIPIVDGSDQINVASTNFNYLTQNKLPLYHSRDSEEYKNTSAPLKIHFGINYYTRYNINITNELEEPSGIQLPELNFYNDVTFVDTVQSVYSNFDWYNNEVFNPPSEVADGRVGSQDDTIGDMEEEHVRSLNKSAGGWHRYEFALPNWENRNEITMVNTRNNISISRDSLDRYPGGSPTTLESNNIGVNLSDIKNIILQSTVNIVQEIREIHGEPPFEGSIEEFGDEFYSQLNKYMPHPARTTYFDWNRLKNGPTAAEFHVHSEMDDNYFIRLRKNKSTTGEPVVLYLEINPNLYCPLDVRVFDQVAFNIIDARHEVNYYNDDSDEDRLHASNRRNYTLRGRRISRPPLGVGRQFEYKVTGIGTPINAGGDFRNNNFDFLPSNNIIYLDSFMDQHAHLYNDESSRYFSLYWNDDDTILQIYRPDDEFQEGVSTIPSIADRNKIYNPQGRSIAFNGHSGNYGLQDTFFQDMPYVHDFLNAGDLDNYQDVFAEGYHDENGKIKQGEDCFFNTTTQRMEFFYYQSGDNSATATKINQNQMLPLEAESIFPSIKGNDGHVDSVIDRITNLYDYKSVNINISAQHEFYSYDQQSYGEYGREFGDHKNIHNRLSDVYKSDLPVIRVQTKGDDSNYEYYGGLDREKNTDGRSLNEDVGTGGRKLVNSIYSEGRKVNRYKNVFQIDTRKPNDFFIKFKMDRTGDYSDRGDSILNPDNDQFVNSDGSIKISPLKFYKVIPDLQVHYAHPSKDPYPRFIKATIGVGVKLHGLNDKNSLGSYREITKIIEGNQHNTDRRDEYTYMFGGIGKDPHYQNIGNGIRASRAGLDQSPDNGFPRSNRYQHLTSNYFTAEQQNQVVHPFIRFGWHWVGDTGTDEDPDVPVQLLIGHMDVEEYPLDFYERGSEELNNNFIKYHVVEWGDEKYKMTDDGVRKSEFFSIYDKESDKFDEFQYKKLLQTVEKAKPIYSDNKLNLSSHTYTEAGVKSIKTIIFRMSKTGSSILETILLNTNIVVNDIGGNLQDFNVYGASDFNVLPLSNIDKEMIIGGISDDSKYVKSIEKIDKNDSYEQKDFLEKEYVDSFLPELNSGSFGKSLTKIDLSTTRIFNKPKSIYEFLTDDIQPIVDNEFNLSGINLPMNSQATDILIDNNDCSIDIDPGNVDGVLLENKANSSEFGVVIGDYTLIKEDSAPILKEDTMDLPIIDKSLTKQAF